MKAEHAIRMTTDFRAAVVELAAMENSGRVVTQEDIRLQRERVAEMEASMRTALLHTA